MASAVQLDIPEFNHAFLTSSQGVIPSPSTSNFNPFYSMKGAKRLTENDISELLVSTINDNGLTPGSTCSTYTHYLDSAAHKTPLHDSTAIFPTAHVPPTGKPRWSDLSVPIEVYARRHSVDPFAKADSQDLHVTEKLHNRILGRISRVADLLFTAQHRVFLFMILVIGRRFRFLRLDRAGIIVTPSVDYYEEPHVLCDIHQEKTTSLGSTIGPRE